MAVHNHGVSIIRCDVGPLNNSRLAWYVSERLLRPVEGVAIIISAALEAA
jgi:hypothetical protein